MAHATVRGLRLHHERVAKTSQDKKKDVGAKPIRPVNLPSPPTTAEPSLEDPNNLRHRAAQMAKIKRIWWEPYFLPDVAQDEEQIRMNQNPP